MSNVTLFGTQNTALTANLADLPNIMGTIAGGTTGSQNRRISIKGKAFREIINGKEYEVSDNNSMNMVVVSAAPVSRMFFAGTYAEGKVVKPTCWSSDSRIPDESVPQDQKQAERCMDCTQNIKGSGAGEGKACRFKQRLAVMLEGKIDKKEIYQLELPATSIFGEGAKDKMPLQAYGKYLSAHNTNIVTIITEMRFDNSSAILTTQSSKRFSIWLTTRTQPRRSLLTCHRWIRSSLLQKQSQHCLRRKQKSKHRLSRNQPRRLLSLRK